MSDFESDVEHADDPSTQGVMAEIVSRVMKFKKDDEVTEEKVTSELKRLGVDNLSDLLHLTEQQVEGIMRPVPLSKLKESLTAEPSLPEATRYTLLLTRALNENQRACLAKKEMLAADQWKDIVHALATDVKEHMKGPRKEADLLKMSKALFAEFPVQFGIPPNRVGDKALLKTAISKLANSISDRITTVKRQASLSPATPRSSKALRFTTAQECGLEPERDQPLSLPPNETPESLEQKRVDMVAMHFGDETFNATKVRRYLKVNYKSIRTDINKKMILTELLTRWPYLGWESALKDHFFDLMGDNVADFSSISQRETEILPSWIEFFRCLSMKKRKGSSAGIPDDLNNILSKQRDLHLTDNRTNLIVVIRCILIHLGIKPDSLFLFFKETTSFDEVQGSRRLPQKGQPVIAVLGQEVLHNPSAYVVVDKRCLYEKPTDLYSALHQLLHAYYVLKVSYELQVAPPLEFLERNIYDLNIDSGSRIQRTKTPNGHFSHQVRDVSRAYSTMIREFTVLQAKYKF